MQHVGRYLSEIYLAQTMPQIRSRINQFIESFLPGTIDRSNEREFIRVKLTISYLLFVTGANFLVSALGILEQNLGLALHPLLASIFSGAGIWYIKYKNRYKGFVTLFMTMGIVSIVNAAIQQEGVISPAVYMLLPLPSITLLLGGRKSAIFIFLLAVCSFFIINQHNSADVGSELLVMQLLSMIICSIATYIFYHLNNRALKRISESTRALELSSKIQADANKTLERTNRQLEEVNNQLAQANEEQSKINEELDTARRAAEQALEFRSAFLATMSHEIRTPMNGVIGMTSLLNGTSLDAEQQDYIDTIRLSGDALLTIINDILDFSKIESGNLELETHPFSVRQCIEETIDLLAIQAEQKQLEFIYHANIPLNDHIIGDITRVRQVLVNLTNNAIKFTEAGSVVLEVEAIPPQPDGTPRLAFTVRDTGIGIPADRMDRLFDPFRQVDASTTRRYGGTGLGLAISKRLCEAMGGQMSVTSQIDKGSAFSFTLPAPPAANKEDETTLPEATLNKTMLHKTMQHNMHVLVIEPLTITSLVLAHELELRGARVTLAETLEAAPLHIMPDAIVLSVARLEEPGNGSSGKTARKIQLPDVWQSIPVLVLLPTGEAWSSADEKAQLHFQNKPVKPERIARMLREAGQHTLPSPKAGAFDPCLQTSPPLQILLVEDNLINQKVALRLFERLGYQADFCGNGLEAIEAIERQPYDLVFMDLQMPELDGLAATKKIRLLKDIEQPCIVAMDISYTEEDKSRGQAAGINGFIFKPINLEQLATMIRKCVQLHGATPGSVNNPAKVASAIE